MFWLQIHSKKNEDQEKKENEKGMQLSTGENE